MQKLKRHYFILSIYLFKLKSINNNNNSHGNFCLISLRGQRTGAANWDSRKLLIYIGFSTN